MFKVLGSIEALNERMNLNLTHHDVNWIQPTTFKKVGILPKVQALRN